MSGAFDDHGEIVLGRGTTSSSVPHRRCVHRGGPYVERLSEIARPSPSAPSISTK
jgi:hypothetical protein